MHNYDERDPRDNPQDIPEHFLVNLTLKESSYLLSLLKEATGYPDEQEIAEDLIYKLNSWTSNPYLSHMLFINVYDRQQVYGGPEEGGWYYHLFPCISSIGYAIDPQDDNPYMYIIDKFIESCDAFDLPIDELDKDEIAECLESTGRYSCSDFDRYGQGYSIYIESLPGEQHDAQRRWYER